MTGLTVEADEHFKTTSFDISEALKQENPRNLFLNGHLFIEMQCDQLLTQYFCEGNTGFDNRRRALFFKFISREIDFFGKINLLKTLELISSEGVRKLLAAKIYVSLQAIGAVRNAFQHNLDYDDALNSLTNGNKFVFARYKAKKLSEYKDIAILQMDFRTEASSLYSALHDLAFELQGSRGSNESGVTHTNEVKP